MPKPKPEAKCDCTTIPNPASPTLHPARPGRPGRDFGVFSINLGFRPGTTYPGGPTTCYDRPCAGQPALLRAAVGNPNVCRVAPFDRIYTRLRLCCRQKPPRRAGVDPALRRIAIRPGARLPVVHRSDPGFPLTGQFAWPGICIDICHL